MLGFGVAEAWDTVDDDGLDPLSLPSVMPVAERTIRKRATMMVAQDIRFMLSLP